MATRLYFPSTGAAPVSPAISVADWSAHINVQRLPLNAINGGSAINTLSYAPDAADHLVAGAAHVAQFVSDLLPPQDIPAQQVKIQVRIAEANANNNLALAWKIYAVSADGQTVLGTLLPLRVDATEAAAALTNRGDAATTTAFTTTENFRLVVELGLSGTPTAASGVQGHNGSFSFGEAATTDLPEDDVATGALNPWIQFARPIKPGIGGSNLVLTGATCAGGGHVHATAQTNGGTIYEFVYDTEALNDPLPEDAIRDTVLGLLRLHNINKTGAAAAAELQAGFVLVI